MPTTPSRRRTAFRAVAALVSSAGLALGAVLAGAPTAAHAATGGYVALGDSYSAGTGTGTYYSDGTDCYRSPKAYASLISASQGRPLTFAACNGATTSDVLNQQVSSLRSDTTLVTITIGGNDVGFVPVLTECAKPGWWGDCDGAIAGALATAKGSLPGRLANVFNQIKQRSPRATVVVAGYPHLFNGEDCNALTFFSPSEEAKLNSAADTLNGVIRRATLAAGYRYADPVPAFAGHAVCDSTEYLNGLSWPIVESYHPNVAGHRAYASVFSPLTGSAGVAASRTFSRTSGTTDARTATAATPILPAGKGRAERVAAPDLSTAEAKAAARRAGISDRELSEMHQAQRRGASNATLQRMSDQAVRG